MTGRHQISRRDVAYIQQYWEPLAAVAWGGHLAQGPGAVVIDRRAGSAPLISYADQATLVAQGIPAHIPDLLDHLAEYNSAGEVVFVVWWEEGIIGYRLRAAELAPPAAYARSQRVFRPLAARQAQAFVAERWQRGKYTYGPPQLRTTCGRRAMRCSPAAWR